MWSFLSGIQRKPAKVIPGVDEVVTAYTVSTDKVVEPLKIALFPDFFRIVHIRDTAKVLIIMSVSFLPVVLEDKLTTPITLSALIAIMFTGIGL